MAQFEPNLRDYWQILRRRRTIIIASTVLVAVLAFWFAGQKVPVYQATVLPEPLTRLVAEAKGGPFTRSGGVAAVTVPLKPSAAKAAAFELEIDRPAIPNVEAWYERLSARPAYREQVMVPFDDLRGRLAF